MLPHRLVLEVDSGYRDRIAALFNLDMQDKLSRGAHQKGNEHNHG